MATNKNLQSLEKLEGISTGLGDKYKPGNQKIQVEAVTTLLSQAKTVVNKADAAQIMHNRITNNREVSFSDLGKLATRVLNALIASGATPQNVADAQSIVRKLSGNRVINRPSVPSGAAAPAADQAPVTTRRARGLDYASMANSFQRLIGMLEVEPSYQPMESELQIATLKDKLQELIENNDAVIHSAEALRQARSDRDMVLYKQSNSVYKVGQLAKVYIKSAFGFGSDIQKAVRKLPFNTRQK